MQGPCQHPPPPPPPRERQSDGSALTKVELWRLRYQRHARTPKGAGSLKSSAPPAAVRRRPPFEIRCRKDLMQVQSEDFNMVNLLRFRFQEKKKVAAYLIWLSDLQLNTITFNLTAKWRPGQGHKKIKLHVLNELTSLKKQQKTFK